MPIAKDNFSHSSIDIMLSRRFKSIVLSSPKLNMDELIHYEVQLVSIHKSDFLSELHGGRKDIELRHVELTHHAETFPFK